MEDKKPASDILMAIIDFILKRIGVERLNANEKMVIEYDGYFIWHYKNEDMPLYYTVDLKSNLVYVHCYYYEYQAPKSGDLVIEEDEILSLAFDIMDYLKESGIAPKFSMEKINPSRYRSIEKFSKS